MYTELLRQLESLRLRTARFRRVALHLHSPDSYDWARGVCDPVRNVRSRFDGDAGAGLFMDELRPHLDLVSVTDHMRCGFATRLSTAAGVSDEFMVLPGMEVNFRLSPPLGFARIHLLVVLPEGATSETFARLFQGQAGIPDDARRTGQEEVTGVTLADWVNRVHQEGGICIAAHVDNEQGIRCRFRQTAQETLKLFVDGDGVALERENDVPENLKEYLLNSGLDGVEVHRTKDVCHYRWVSQIDGKAKWIATALTFDAHNVEEFGRSDRVTHIKMTRLGLKDLQAALTFPDTRIRFPDNLPSPPSPHLLGIEISGTDKSFFQHLAVALTENLNCLIGVRGSGKSTVVEALRYVFGYNRTLDELDKLKAPIREMQKANLAGCILRVAYRTKVGDDRILSATFDEKDDYVTRVSTVTGEPLQVSDVEACGDYPLRLFGWSEIETLGRSPSKQRDLLDRLIPELFPVLQRRRDLRNELRANRGSVTKAIAGVKAAFEKDGGVVRRFKEFQADFNKLNTSEVKGLFAAFDLVQEKKRLLLRLKQNADELVEELTSSTPVTLRSEVDEVLAKSSPELRAWWLEQEIARLDIAAAELDMHRCLQQAIQRIRTFTAVVAEHTSQVNTEIESLERNLRERFAADDAMQRVADLRANAEKRLRQAAAIRDAYLKEFAALMAILQERKVITDKLTSVQNEIAGVRVKYNRTVEETLNRFLPPWMRVSIRFDAGADTEEFSKKLYAIFGAKGNQPKKVRQLLQMLTTPVSLAQAILDGVVNDIVGKSVTIDGAVIEFIDDDAELCVEKTSPFEHDEHADVDVLTKNGDCLGTILDMQEVPWDDSETILLNGGPVNEKSPGQRSSAMLPLIALAENTPLVIDQPEDNLDKRLIGSVLMKVLAELKEKRQIIVCTHDPNILVGGDAEQVVVLEAESDRRGKVAKHGSIDNDDIVETVIDLLEGGAEAFAARRMRYSGHAGLIP